MASILQPGFLYWDGFKYTIVPGPGGSPGPASGDLSGNYPNPIVVGITGKPISLSSLVAGNSIIYNGTNWVNQTITATGFAGGDLAGTYPDPTVINIQGNPVSNTAPTLGEALAWNGSMWVPTSISGTFTAGHDLSGSSTSQTVIGLQGYSVSSTAPASNQVLAWNGAAWIPTNLSSGFTAGGDLTGSSTNQYIQSLSGANNGGGAITLAISAYISSAHNQPILKINSNTFLQSDNSDNISISSAAGLEIDTITYFQLSHNHHRIISMNESNTDYIVLGDTVANSSTTGLIRTSYNGGSGQAIIGLNYGGTSFVLLSSDNAVNTVLQAPTGSANILNVNGTNIFQASGSGIALGSSPSYGSGTGVFFLENAGVNPSTSPNNGAILYATSGDLWVKQSDGTNFQISSGTIIENNGSTLAGGSFTTFNLEPGLIATNAGSGTANVNFGFASQATGDLPYFNGTNWVRRAIGSPGNILTVSGGVPTWVAPSGTISFGPVVANTNCTASTATIVATVTVVAPASGCVKIDTYVGPGGTFSGSTMTISAVYNTTGSGLSGGIFLNADQMKTVGVNYGATSAIAFNLTPSTSYDFFAVITAVGGSFNTLTTAGGGITVQTI